MWFVYIIKSSIKDWYYVGSTNSLERRLKEHNSGKCSSTKFYRPLDLVYKKEFDAEQDTRAYEKLLKTKRIEKEKIIKQL